MQRFTGSRRTFVALAVLLLLLAATVNTFYTVKRAALEAATYAALGGSYAAAPAGAHLRGNHAKNAKLTISVALAPRNEAQLESLLTGIYTPGNPLYHHWLHTGDFERLFGPTSSQLAQVQSFVAAAGLKVITSSSPFLVQATGTTAQVEAAFHTGINDYTATSGKSFFQNDSPVQVPISLGNSVLAVVGLSNTAPMHPHYIRTMRPHFIRTDGAAHQANRAVPLYGAGPGGSGLVPSQTASLYGASGVYNLGARGQGKGVTLAVFEVSGYTPSDITTYEHRFFGPSENVPLVDINVDGGPLAPLCPKGDTCNKSPDYSGDIEVAADIETQIAIAPQIDRILVYNAPNDTNSITILHEYFKIAADNLADAISTSWGFCERDANHSTVQAEATAFEQMALQGQSIFAASGDSGAYACLRGTGYSGLNVEDPSTQPFVTSVGGTSFGTFDPGSNLHPVYPKGFETVWNVLEACNGTPSGLAKCSSTGASGGGVSSFWSRPSYQHGPGVTTSFSQKAPYCQPAALEQYCREVPDVAANADEFTPYAEYCTGNPATNSLCALISSTRPAPGWFGIGGTSLASPLWSGVIALWDSVHGERFGSANDGLYLLLRSHDAYSRFYHDITGKNQTENNNGYYPTTPTYDLATGIGTPRISDIVASKP